MTDFVSDFDRPSFGTLRGRYLTAKYAFPESGPRDEDRPRLRGDYFREKMNFAWANTRQSKAQFVANDVESHLEKFDRSLCR